MSINSIGFSNSFFYQSCPGITEATLRKLIALGIDPSTVHSESEARTVIERVLEARKQAGLPLPFEEEKSKISAKQNISTQTEENSQNMMSMLAYESDVKKIILGL